MCPTAGERALSQCYCLYNFPGKCLFILNITTCWELSSPTPAGINDINKCIFEIIFQYGGFGAGRQIPTAGNTVGKNLQGAMLNET